MQNFEQQFQTPLSQKQKNFSGLVIAFLKCGWNLEHFQRTDEYRSLFLSEIIDAERRGYLNLQKGLSSEHHSVMNVLTGSKHCWNQHGIAINLFSRQFDVNWVGKILL